jgi:CheY-like chemotaxis protein
MKQAKILLVDDDRITLRLLDNILKSENYQTTTFLNAKEAIAHIETTNDIPNIIISDYFLPDISGLDFLNQIKSRTEYVSIPFLFISTSKNEDIETEALQYGAIDFLQKPINKQLLINKINVILQSLGNFSLNANRVFEGDRSMMKIQDIISYCEGEKLDGFALIIHNEQYGVLTFINGLLDTIRYDNLNDSAALENLEQIESYEIIIFRGKFDENIIKNFFQRRTAPVKQTKSSILTNSLKGKMPTDKYNDLTILLKELSNTSTKLEKALDDKWNTTTIIMDKKKRIEIKNNTDNLLEANIIVS